MASAQDYPINFPYGATSAPYSPTRPHRGDDRPCPAGTSLEINGQQIALTGATGYVFGAHLHAQEWKDSYSNTRKPINTFKPGVVVNIDRDGTQGDKSFGKFITIRNADGWNTSYCHLSVIGNINVGDTIGVNMATPVDVLRIIATEVEGFPLIPTHTGQYDKMLTDAWGSKPTDDFVRHAWKVQPVRRGELQAQVAALTKDKNDLTAENAGLKQANLTLTTQLAEVTKQNEALTKQNAELQAKVDAIDNGDAIIITRDSWNGLFDLIREYFKKKG